MARLFDGKDESGRWRIDPGRPRVDDPDERARLARFLAAGFVILRITSLGEDVLDPGHRHRVPRSTHTDGTWIWSGAVRYYLLEHGIAPEPEFVAHIRSRDYVPHEPAEAEWRAALDHVTNR